MGSCGSKQSVQPGDAPAGEGETQSPQEGQKGVNPPAPAKDTSTAETNEQQDNGAEETNTTSQDTGPEPTKKKSGRRLSQADAPPSPAQERWTNDEDAESQDAQQAQIQSEVESAAEKGVTAVLELMRKNSDDPAYQWWCCDAINSLCAGQEERRAEFYSQKGISDILNAMRLFQWDEHVQMKAASVLQAMASDYADQLGKSGGVAAVLEGMKSCTDSYQVQVSCIKALQALSDNCRENLLRARAMKGLDILSDTLVNHPEDGQLQYRGQHLLDMLKNITDEELEKLESLQSGRSNPWSKLRAAVFAGKAKEIASGNIPGEHGISGQVAEALKNNGVEAVLDMLVHRMASTEACDWCLDALATEAQRDADIRRRIVEHDGIKKSKVAAKRHIWSDAVQFKAFWLWSALGADYPKELGEQDIIDSILEGMVKCETDYLTQSQAVKAFQAILRLEMNRVRAVRLGTVKRIFQALENNIDDGELQYRGMQLLEGLERGSSANIREKVVSRTQSGAGMESMRAEAREKVRDTGSRHSNRSADEIAEEVDEDNLDELVDDGGNAVSDSANQDTENKQQNGDVDNSAENHTGGEATTENAQTNGGNGDAHLGETKTGDEGADQEETDHLGETKTGNEEDEANGNLGETKTDNESEEKEA